MITESIFSPKLTVKNPIVIILFLCTIGCICTLVYLRTAELFCPRHYEDLVLQNKSTRFVAFFVFSLLYTLLLHIVNFIVGVIVLNSVKNVYKQSPYDPRDFAYRFRVNYGIIVTLYTFMNMPYYLDLLLNLFFNVESIYLTDMAQICLSLSGVVNSFFYFNFVKLNSPGSKEESLHSNELTSTSTNSSRTNSQRNSELSLIATTLRNDFNKENNLKSQEENSLFASLI